jgi:hypothetical protein
MENFRSLISEWFFGAGERQVVPVSASRRLALLALFVVLGYGPAWLLVYLAEGGLARLLASLAPAVTAMLGEPLRFYSNGNAVYFVSEYGRRFEAWVDSREIMSDLPLLLTLMLVSPGLKWQRRLLYTLAAVGLALVVYTAFLVTKVQVVLVTANQATTGSPAFWTGADDFFEVTGKTFFPVFIWLLFALPYLLGRIDRRGSTPVADRPSRNAPCPCGSGLKYKKCCGA